MEVENYDDYFSFSPSPEIYDASFDVSLCDGSMAPLHHQDDIIFMSRIEYSHTLLPVCSLMTALTSSLEIMISPQLSPHNNVLLIRSSGEDNVKRHLTF